MPQNRSMKVNGGVRGLLILYVVVIVYEIYLFHSISASGFQKNAEKRQKTPKNISVKNGLTKNAEKCRKICM
jgi:hypothetical protein